MMRDAPATRSLIVSLVFLYAIAALGQGSVLAAPVPVHSASSPHSIQDTESIFGAADLDDTLRLVGPIQLPSLDPALTKDLGTMFLVRQLFAGLMRFDTNLEPVPALAASVEVSDDGLTYRFTLRDDARFYDGRRITADDVVFSITRTLDPATAGGNGSALSGPTFFADIAGTAGFLNGSASDLAGIRALDEATVEITLERPRSTFLMRLASAPGSIIDRRDLSLGEGWWQSPNASGPFAVAEFVEDNHILLERNQHFAVSLPRLEQVWVRIGTAAFGGLHLYESGDIDVIGVDYLNIERIIDPSNPLSGELRESPQLSVEYIAFRTDVPPLDDPAVRRALLAAFPREKIASVTFNGRVTAAEGVIPSGMLGIDAWPVMFRDETAEAIDLLESSSYAEPRETPTIEIYAAVPNRAESFRDVIERDLGLDVEVIVVEWQSYLRGLASRDYPAYLLYWGADYPDPESMLLTLFGSDAADNYIGYDNPDFDALLDAAAAEQDPEVRADLYRQANQMLIDDAVVLPLYYDVAYTLVKPRVQGLEVTPMGILYLDSVWIES
jgi:oligopeptide transport system substrate-binding protein